MFTFHFNQLGPNWLRILCVCASSLIKSAFQAHALEGRRPVNTLPIEIHVKMVIFKDSFLYRVTIFTDLVWYECVEKRWNFNLSVNSTYLCWWSFSIKQYEIWRHHFQHVNKPQHRFSHSFPHGNYFNRKYRFLKYNVDFHDQHSLNFVYN